MMELTNQDIKDINMICENAIAELPLCLSFTAENATELYDGVEAFVLEGLVPSKKYKITIEEV